MKGKTQSKIGKRSGRPTYRTPSMFRVAKSIQSAKVKALSSERKQRSFGKKDQFRK